MLAEDINHQGEELFSQGDWYVAREAFKRALDIEPGFATAHNNLGVIYWETGEIIKALEHFKQAVHLKPHDCTFLANYNNILKECLSLQGKSPQAQRSFILKQIKNARRMNASFDTMHWSRENHKTVLLRWQRHLDWVVDGPVRSAVREQQKIVVTDASKNYVFTPCPLCKEDQYKTFYSETGGDYSVVQCEQCGFLYRNPTYTSRRIKAVYNRGYLNFLSGDYARGRERKYRAVLKQLELEKRTAAFKRRRLLDVGCGHGLFLTVARELGWEPYGLDFSNDCIRHARTVFGLKQISAGNLEENSFETNFFDAVTLWSVAAHLEDPLAMFRKIGRVLRPGGLLIIYTVDGAGLIHQLQLSHWNGFHGNHLVFFTPDSLHHALTLSGFTGVDVLYENRLLNQAIKAGEVAADDEVYFRRLSAQQNLGNMMKVIAVNS